MLLFLLHVTEKFELHCKILVQNNCKKWERHYSDTILGYFILVSINVTLIFATLYKTLCSSCHERV